MNKEMSLKKIFRVLLFVLLVIIDVVRNVGNDWQMTLASQGIGFIVAGLIILHYGIKTFLKWYNLFWILLCIVLIWSMKFWFFDEVILYYYLYEMYLAIFNICIFGMILTKLICDIVRKDIRLPGGRFGVKSCMIMAWLLYMISAVIAKDNTYRPEFYLLYFGVFYLIEFEKEEIMCILQDMCNGILIGFWGVQLLALFFRPFVDSHNRYSGMYYNSNIYDLACLIVLLITLVKLTIARRKNTIKSWQYLFWMVQYGAIISLIILSVGRLSIALAVFITGVYCVHILLINDRVKIKKVILLCCTYILIICMVLPLTFLCVSYIPRILKKPISFIDEYRRWGDLNNVDNYVSVEEALRESLGRFATLFIDYQEVEINREDLDAPVVDNRPLDPNWETAIYYLDEENYDSVDLRLAIWKTYLDEVSWEGHTIDEWMLWVSPHEKIWHAHNIVIMQMYVYGIANGVFFCIWMVLYYVCAWKYYKKTKQIFGFLPLMMFLLFIGFGMFEINHMYGQISWNLMFILQKVILDRQVQTK